MRLAVRTPRHVYVLAALTILLCVCLLLVSGNVAVALAPVLIVVLGQGVVKAPLRLTTGIFVFAALLIEDVRANPHMGLWKSPLYAVGRFVYDGLDKGLGIPGLKIYGIEVMFLLIVGLVVLSAFWSKRQVGRPPSALIIAALVAGTSLVLLEVWGIARGGNVSFSILQVRPMAFTVATIVAFACVLRTPADSTMILGIIVVVGLLRSLLAFYVYQVVMPGQEAFASGLGSGVFITTHADSVLWVTGVHICLIALMLRPSWRMGILTACIVPILGTAIVINNRRLAIVSLVWGIGILYFFVKPAIRKWANRLAIGALPLLLVYIAVGWSSNGGWAKPVRSIRSIVLSEDASVDMRSIENYNLLITAKRHMVLGKGAGQPYDEIVAAIDITDKLEAYLYLPHNSLMWLMGAGGIIVFTGYWMLLAVAVWIAIRVYHRTTHYPDEVAALAAVLAVNSYAMQAIGDMGLFSWLSIGVMTSLLGLMSGRAAQIGALS